MLGPLRKLNARLARQISGMRYTVVVLVNAAAFATAHCLFARRGRHNKSLGDRETTEVAESKRSEN